jgi:hypothetical protein
MSATLIFTVDLGFVRVVAAVLKLSLVEDD